MVFLIVMLISLCAAGCWLMALRSRRDLMRLQAYERHADRFFEASEALASDPDTPDSVLDVLRALNAVIDDPARAQMMFAVIESSLQRPERTPSQDPADPVWRDFETRRPELVRVVMDACLNGLLAASFLGRRWGQWARALIAHCLGLAEVRRLESDVVSVLRRGAAGLPPARLPEPA